MLKRESLKKRQNQDFELLITRVKSYPQQTQSIFLIVNKSLKIFYSGVMLELPANANTREISRIPEGVYNCTQHRSPRHGLCFSINNVYDRENVLIHIGNYVYQTKGCVLPGSSFQDINADGLMDVVNSRQTLDGMLALLPSKFKLTIKN